MMVTVFTPVYNRAHTIEQLYQSLLKQTDMNFEWIIVDDGSEDELSLLVHKWIQERKAIFKIRFYQKKNGGKHSAINWGVQLAKGEAFFIVDSDDYVTKDAIQVVRGWWKTILCDNKFAGISGFRGTKAGKIIGENPLFSTFVDATNMERGKYGLWGDKAEVYRTSILEKYVFPEFEGENFLTEAVVWDKIAYDGLKIRWFNKMIVVCEYREDGLTNQGKELFIKNPKGWGLYIAQKCQYYSLSAKEKMGEYFEYYINLIDKISRQEIKKNLEINEEILIQIEDLNKHCIKQTIDKIGKRIALYGVGNKGKKLLKIYKNSEVEVCYILDQKKIDLPWLQIDLDDKYPVVDAIMITPEEGEDEIIEFLKKRTNNKLIGYSEWKVLFPIKIV